MGVFERARAHLRRRAALAKRAAAEITRLWNRVDKANIAASWQASIPAALTVVESAQAISAASAGMYLDDLLEDYGLPEGSEGRINVAAFAGTASDGRSLGSLLYQPAITALKTIQQGGTERRALAAGRFTSELIVRTQVADAGRVADGVALTARPQLAGWIRMLSLPSCARCIILAGKFYRWNAGFQRHPACDCVHIPAPEDIDDLRTDPMAAFRSMDEAEQDRVFTKAGAQAIRDGADIFQVVNARRGITTAAPPVKVKTLRSTRVTTEGTTRRGMAGRRLQGRARLLPEEIYRQAGGDREEALRLLSRHGYLFGAPVPQQRRSEPVVLQQPEPVTPTPFPVGPRTQTPQAPRPAVPIPAPAAPELAGSPLEQGIASGIRERKKLSGGEVAEVELVTFNDGSQAVRKVAATRFAGYSPLDLTDHEDLVAKVGKALGAPIPAVVRTGDTEVFMEYVSDARPATNVLRRYKGSERNQKIGEYMETREGRLLGLLDLLVANNDRHEGNWLVRKDGTIVGIDHGIAWPPGQITEESISRWAPSFESPFAEIFSEGRAGNGKPTKGWLENDLTQADLSWIRDQLESLRPEFDARGRGNWLDYSLARLRQMTEWAAGDVNRIRP